MTSTLDSLPLRGADDPATVLAYARDQKRVEDDAAREVLKAAARWAAMHSAESLVGPADGWHESCLPLGGQGCPEVAEFAVIEFAAAMGRSTESGRRYLSHAVEGCYRLPRCWARVESGELAAWRLASIADRTICLSPEAAAFVDAKVAPFAHTIGPAQLGRLVEKQNAGPPPRPATSTSASQMWVSRAESVSTATWTWPTPWTWRPRSPRTPTSNWPSARPTPWTSAAPPPPATSPATSRPST